MLLLANHIAAVTGGGSGIGRAIASGYAREGARLVVLDINGEAAAETAKEIRDTGGKAPCLLYQELDLVLKTARDLFTDDIEKIVIDSSSEFGRLKRFVEE